MGTIVGLVALLLSPAARAGDDLLGTAGHFTYLKANYGVDGAVMLDSGPRCQGVRVLGGGIYLANAQSLGALNFAFGSDDYLTDKVSRVFPDLFERVRTPDSSQPE